MFDANDQTTPVTPEKNQVPYCKIHFCELERYAEKSKKKYYRCKVDGCETRESIATDCAVPKAPHICPCCATPTALTVVKYGPFFVNLGCPSKGCGFSLQVARPDIKQQKRRVARDQVDILDDLTN